MLEDASKVSEFVDRLSRSLVDEALDVPFLQSTQYRHRRLHAPGRSVFREHRASWLGGPKLFCLEAIVR